MSDERQYKVVIRNLRTKGFGNFKDQFRVDRKSCLGNPYIIDKNIPNSREDVCAKYRELYDNVLLFSEDCKAELHKMANVLRLTGKIELWCWCAPEQCHADIIKEHLLSHMTTVYTR